MVLRGELASSHIRYRREYCRAVSRLNSVRQSANEDEDAYFERFASLHTACGNYLPKPGSRSLFISGLDVRIADTVPRLRRFEPDCGHGTNPSSEHVDRVRLSRQHCLCDAELGASDAVLANPLRKIL